jgi:hypothetical protein
LDKSNRNLLIRTCLVDLDILIQALFLGSRIPEGSSEFSKAWLMRYSCSHISHSNHISNPSTTTSIEDNEEKKNLPHEPPTEVISPQAVAHPLHSRAPYWASDHPELSSPSGISLLQDTSLYSEPQSTRQLANGFQILASFKIQSIGQLPNGLKIFLSFRSQSIVRLPMDSKESWTSKCNPLGNCLKDC